MQRPRRCVSKEIIVPGRLEFAVTAASRSPAILARSGREAAKPSVAVVAPGLVSVNVRIRPGIAAAL
jgi:hypothetical protein